MLKNKNKHLITTVGKDYLKRDKLSDEEQAQKIKDEKPKISKYQRPERIKSKYY